MLSAERTGDRAVDQSHFKQAAGRWATGCAVIASLDAEGKAHGLTMSAITSLSLDPMQFLICLDKGARTLAAIRASQRFSINVLEQDQVEIAKLFASKSDDKFKNLSCEVLSGAPVIEGSLCWIVCKLAHIHAGGDHDIVIGDVLDIRTSDGEPLLHFQGSFGHFLKASQIHKN